MLQKALPRQFNDKSWFTTLDSTSNSLQVVTNLAFLSNIGLTVCFSLSLKAMWNLMHVMQVIVFTLYVVKWPANAELLIEAMREAITLEDLLDSLYAYVLPSYLFEKDQEDD